MNHYLIFNNQSSQNIISQELYISHIDGTDEIITGLTREGITGESTTLRLIPNQYGTKYTDTIKFSFTFVKPDYTAFTLTEKRSIAKWLTSPRLPEKLVLYPYGEDTEYYFRARCVDITYNRSGNGDSALTASFENDSAFMYHDDEKVYQIPESGKSISYINESDESENYTYPVITLTNMSSQDELNITLLNISDGNQYCTVRILKQLSLIIDCQTNRITDEAGIVSFKDLGWTDVGHVYFPRLIGGENLIKITGGQCTVSIKTTSLIKGAISDDI